MTGPEHWREAEKLLEHVCDADCHAGHSGYVLARAQVHATLALAAPSTSQDVSQDITR